MSFREAFAPAKINLFLAITGRRPDGYHDLVSVVAPVDWGDTVEVELVERGFSVACDRADVPLDDSNLVIRAAKAFAEGAGWSGGARFRIRKLIPPGAGFGGASSNAAAALVALNELSGAALPRSDLARIASHVGSDCALFLAGAPTLMRGRGERIEPLPPEACERLSGRRILLFKPWFPISTPWAYAQLVRGAPHSYLSPSRAEARLEDWIEDPSAGAEELLFNSMEPPAFAKYPALPVFLGQLAERFGLRSRMTGSGSACFALAPYGFNEVPVREALLEAWGPSALFVDTRIA